MPQIAFAANFLWVLILSLFGPSLPGIIHDLSIDYPRAGLFFTVLSAGSMVGTTFGSIASDYLNRKRIFLLAAAFLTAGLLLLGFSTTYISFLLFLTLLSIFGSPIGAVGQTIMLSLFPEHRNKNLTIMAFFSASGSFTAPLIVSLTYIIGGNWRFTFWEVSTLGILLFIGMLFTFIPSIKQEAHKKKDIRTVLKNPAVLFSFVILFLYISIDFGFSYWLAEYIKKVFSTGIKLASASVSIYLAGTILGRFLTSKLLKRFSLVAIIKHQPLLGLTAFSLFLFAQTLPVKMALVFFYGIGVAPFFPLFMAYGTSAFPEQPGAVTGILFAAISLGGIVFPFLLGVIASFVGIQHAYIFTLIMLIVIISLTWLKIKEQ
ncbi:MAG: MFS transporter [Spirochaetales bacterium]|nr:MFS transporter [Spirochaetales bacterium]